MMQNRTINGGTIRADHPAACNPSSPRRCNRQTPHACQRVSQQPTNAATIVALSGSMVDMITERRAARHLGRARVGSVFDA